MSRAVRVLILVTSMAEVGSLHVHVNAAFSRGTPRLRGGGVSDVLWGTSVLPSGTADSQTNVSLVASSADVVGMQAVQDSVKVAPSTMHPDALTLFRLESPHMLSLATISTELWPVVCSPTWTSSTRSAVLASSKTSWAASRRSLPWATSHPARARCTPALPLTACVSVKPHCRVKSPSLSIQVPGTFQSWKSVGLP